MKNRKTGLENVWKIKREKRIKKNTKLLNQRSLSSSPFLTNNTKNEKSVFIFIILLFYSVWPFFVSFILLSPHFSVNEIVVVHMHSIASKMKRKINKFSKDKWSLRLRSMQLRKFIFVFFLKESSSNSKKKTCIMMKKNMLAYAIFHFIPFRICNAFYERSLYGTVVTAYDTLCLTLIIHFFYFISYSLFLT